MIFVLFLLTLVVGLLAQWHVKRTYARHSRTPTVSGYTGAEAAHEILRQAGITDVDIVEHEELLGDHYAAFISSLIFFLWHLLPLLTGRQRN